MKIILILLCAAAALTAASRLIWGRSLAATIAAAFIRVTPLRAKFKASAAATRRRVEARREEACRLPALFRPSFPLTERTVCGLRVFFLTTEAPARRVLFYVHGGGFLEEITLLHWRFLDRLARKTGAAVVVPLYPLVPQHTYKDTYPAIVDAYRQIAAENPGCKLMLGGDSAGGNIALVLAGQLSPAEQPEELILLSPAVDMRVDERDPAEADCFRKCTLVGIEGLNVLGEYWAGGAEEAALPWVSPINGELPPLKRVSLFIGERDMGYAMGLRLADKLRAAGVETELIIGRGMNHVWPVYPIPEARQAQKKIAEIMLR